MEQTQFITDLTDFIKNHPYYKNTSTTPLQEPEPDTLIFESNDPDGDYERAVIKITLIP